MASKLKITGEKEIIKNLSRDIAKIEGDISKGLLAAAIFVQGEAMDLTPVDFGVLRNSAFASVGRVGDMLLARVGFTAKYAPWVHEMPMTLKGQPRSHFGETSNRSEAGPVKSFEFGGGSGKGNYWDGGENKFLEKAVVRNTDTILKIIIKRAKR